MEIAEGSKLKEGPNEDAIQISYRSSEVCNGRMAEMKKRKPTTPRNLRPRNPDAAVFSMARRFGKDVTGMEKVDFYLYFSVRSDAELAQKELLASGFSVELTKSAMGSKWLCLATKKISRKVEDLVAKRMDLVELARKYHGEYDGWETQIK